jgi:hypothetical protein
VAKRVTSKMSMILTIALLEGAKKAPILVSFTNVGCTYHENNLNLMRSFSSEIALDANDRPNSSCKTETETERSNHAQQVFGGEGST